MPSAHCSNSGNRHDNLCHAAGAPSGVRRCYNSRSPVRKKSRWSSSFRRTWAVSGKTKNTGNQFFHSGPARLNYLNPHNNSPGSRHPDRPEHRVLFPVPLGSRSNKKIRNNRKQYRQNQTPPCNLPVPERRTNTSDMQNHTIHVSGNPLLNKRNHKIKTPQSSLRQQSITNNLTVSQN